MKTGSHFRRGYVFLATLGVMAVAFLLVLAMSGSTGMAWRSSRRALDEIQREIALQSTVEYALQMKEKGFMAHGKDEKYRIVVDHLRDSSIEGSFFAHEAGPKHPVYRGPTFDHRPGDVLVRIASRIILCNELGNRTRPIDVTETMKHAFAKK